MNFIFFLFFLCLWGKVFILVFCRNCLFLFLILFRDVNFFFKKFLDISFLLSFFWLIWILDFLLLWLRMGDNSLDLVCKELFNFIVGFGGIFLNVICLKIFGFLLYFFLFILFFILYFCECLGWFLIRFCFLWLELWECNIIEVLMFKVFFMLFFKWFIFEIFGLFFILFLSIFILVFSIWVLLSCFESSFLK